MDSSIASFLAVDGIVGGAVYALMAIAIVLVFSVTRVLFIAQGEFVVFGAATLFQLQSSAFPTVVWLLLGTAACCCAQEMWVGLRGRTPFGTVAANVTKVALVPAVVAALAWAASGQRLPVVVQVALTIAIITPMGPLLHRLVYRSLSTASVLTLLIVSVGVHFGMTSLALAVLGPEGFRTAPLLEQSFSWGAVALSGQSVVIIAAVVLLMATLSVAFNKTFRGKALRASAVNQLGARLVGLSPNAAGQLAFGLAAGLGAVCGILISPTVTIFYDTGFLIGLKGFVAAVFAGLASFPGALLGSLAVGLIESFSSFFASSFKDSIVFAAVIPILLWRSFMHPGGEEH